MFLDSFEAHKTEEVIAEFDKLNINYKYIPPGFTSSLQPLDVCINKPFKDVYKAEWNEWMSNGSHEFTNNGNRKKPSYQTLVDMVSKCVKQLGNDKNLIKKSFVSSGIINIENSVKNYNQRLKDILINEKDWEIEAHYYNTMKSQNFHVEAINEPVMEIEKNNYLHLVLTDDDDDDLHLVLTADDDN